MIRQTLTIQGKHFVLLEEAELRQLERRATKAESKLPTYPPADAKGNRPAVEYLRVSIARDIVQERQALGLSQERLASLAGLRQETLSRLESGKHSPTVRTVEKIDQALKKFGKSSKKTRSRKQQAK